MCVCACVCVACNMPLFVCMCVCQVIISPRLPLPLPPFGQVTEETARALESCSYQVEERGKVFVKGKGDLTTFFVIGKGGTLGRM